MEIAQPFTFPNGQTTPNRLVKSAMSEAMGSSEGAPTDRLIHLYRTWSQGGTGLLITGNVIVDPAAKGEKMNVVLEDDRFLDLHHQWAEAGQHHGTKIWMQINHPGRQAPKFNQEVVAPSAIPFQHPKLQSFFIPPRALTNLEITAIIQRFATTAALAEKAGFDGVQIHGAHGYLVSQFLSPLVNQRQDEWGGSPAKRAKFVLEIYRQIRAKTTSNFAVGIKINSADFQKGGFSEEESIEVIQRLSEEGMDLIEVSGGTYEKAAMMGARKKSTQEREAYFGEFIVKARKVARVPLLLTGGFRTVEAMNQALADNELDLIGLARPLALVPDLSNQLLTGKTTKWQAPTITTGIRVIDRLGGIELPWYQLQLERMAKGRPTNPKLSAFRALFKFLWEFVLSR
jgi:2,4-dienoyl-CoA reductase-like NADH-dependent reductase (Old Yellow Enzyme family)